MKKEKVKKQKKTKRKIFVFLIVLLIAGFSVYMALHIPKTSKPVEEKKKVVDEIKKFDYTVSESDTKLFKDEFKNLKTLLLKDEVDNKEYASLVAKLFVIDFYTLSNKNSVNDVGGVQFVYSSYKADFVDYARHGIYKQVKSNLDNDRNQDLPEVDSINVESVEEVVPSAILSHSDFSGVTEANSYEVKVNWTYKNNNNFQTSATLLIVPNGDKLSVAKLD